MAKRWFDDYLLANERKTQVSHKAPIARERKRKIDAGEMKFVPTYEGVTKSASERNQQRLKNARRSQSNSSGNSESTVRSTLREAFNERKRKVR